jgi:hypothetical protein
VDQTGKGFVARARIPPRRNTISTSRRSRDSSISCWTAAGRRVSHAGPTIRAATSPRPLRRSTCRSCWPTRNRRT